MTTSPTAPRHVELMRTNPRTRDEAIAEIARVLYETPGSVERAWLHESAEYGWRFEIQMSRIHGNTVRCHNDSPHVPNGVTVRRAVWLALRIAELAAGREGPVDGAELMEPL